MLRSEKTSSNEEDTLPALLGENLCLTLDQSPDMDFLLSPESAIQASTAPFSCFEE